jgi:hypothetical protein
MQMEMIYTDFPHDYGNRHFTGYTKSRKSKVTLVPSALAFPD